MVPNATASRVDSSCFTICTKDVAYKLSEVGLSISLNGKSLSWTGLTREWWCCTVGLVSRLDMNTCQTSIKTDILLEHC